MNVLGITPGHNGSVALVSDNKLIFYVEEERLSRSKYDGSPLLGILEALENYEIDVVVIGGTDDVPALGRLPWINCDAFTGLIKKKLRGKDIKIVHAGLSHHLGHAALAFYNSGFDKALSVVIDGCGSFSTDPEVNLAGWETDTVFICEYPNKFQLVSKKLCYGPTFGQNPENFAEFYNGILEYSVGAPTVKAYEGVSDYLGFGFIEIGRAHV